MQICITGFRPHGMKTKHVGIDIELRSLRKCTVLQIGKSLVLFQMVSLEFFINLILPIAL